MIPVQAWNKVLLLNVFPSLVPGAERGKPKTAHELVRRAAAKSTVRLNMTATEIHHGFVAFSTAFPLPLWSTGRDALTSLSSTVDNY